MSLYNKMLFPKIQLKEFKSQVCQVLEGLEKLLNVIMVDWKKNVCQMIGAKVLIWIYFHNNYRYSIFE